MSLLIIQLLIAHFIGDFLFQPTKWIESKSKRIAKSKHLYYHILVHLVALLCTLQFQIGKYWLAIVFILISHYFIDILKLHYSKKSEKWWYFWLDQLAHLSIIAIVVYFFYPYQLDFSLLYAPNSLFLIAMLLFVTMVVSVIMKVTIGKLYTPKGSKDSLPQAGLYIGILERILVFTFVVLNFWQAIGFLIAAKSVFRFGDLSKADDRKKTEYILIGTLFSFLLAIMAGLVYNYVLDKGLLSL